jgi:hypothetical protein
MVSRCLLIPKSHGEASEILKGNAAVAVKYMAYRTWRQSVMFNIAVIMASMILGKMLTNFMERKPGFAGFRVIK